MEVLLAAEYLADGAVWNAFDAINAVRYGPEWTTNIITPETTIFTDIQHGTLPTVSWVIPDAGNSDHPGSRARHRAVVGCAASSTRSARARTGIDRDRRRVGRLGRLLRPRSAAASRSLGRARLPRAVLIVSPYARKLYPSQPGYVSHTQYEFGSILNSSRTNWGSGQPRHDRRARQQHRRLLRLHAAAAKVHKNQNKILGPILRTPKSLRPPRRRRIAFCHPERSAEGAE